MKSTTIETDLVGQEIVLAPSDIQIPSLKNYGGETGIIRAVYQGEDRVLLFLVELSSGKAIEVYAAWNDYYSIKRSE